MKDKFFHLIAAAVGAIVSFFCELPAIILALLAVMSLDFVTGIVCGIMGRSKKTEHGSLSSSTAFLGLLKKVLILAIVALAHLMDYVVAQNIGVQFAAISGATCLWFVASEGISVVENAAQMGVPIPKAMRQALEVMKGSDGSQSTQKDNNIQNGADNTNK